jgi:hypothetical protein
MRQGASCTWLLALVACGQPLHEGDDGLSETVSATTEPACFGRAPFTICLPAAPTTLLSIAAPTTTTINTDTSPMCAPVVTGGNVCVLAGSVITLKSKLRATGRRPLVLIANLAIVTNGVIDVGSRRHDSVETGAGADPASCATAGDVPPGHAAGGAGGSHLGRGGAGGGDFSGELGGVSGEPVSGTTLRGGCPGQASETGRLGGHGGGAVMLIAVNSIRIESDINAAGQGGDGGVNFTDGGGGGGAGGMIVLEAPTVIVTGMLLANGGGGGTGGDDGAGGADPFDVTAALGGGSSGTGGAGGDGAAGVVAGSGADGLRPVGRNNVGAGGGGGGGGAGVILAPANATLGTQVSPPAIGT